MMYPISSFNNVCSVIQCEETKHQVITTNLDEGCKAAQTENNERMAFMFKGDNKGKFGYNDN